jgi:hypothetical protein
MIRRYDEEFQASTIVNGNEVKLYRKYYQNGKYSYYIYWGEANIQMNKQELLTPSGRTPSVGGAIKQFLRAAKAAQHLKFSRL